MSEGKLVTVVVMKYCWRWWQQGYIPFFFFFEKGAWGKICKKRKKKLGFFVTLLVVVPLKNLSAVQSPLVPRSLGPWVVVMLPL